MTLSHLLGTFYSYSVSLISPSKAAERSEYMSCTGHTTFTFVTFTE